MGGVDFAHAFLEFPVVFLAQLLEQLPILLSHEEAVYLFKGMDLLLVQSDLREDLVFQSLPVLRGDLGTLEVGVDPKFEVRLRIETQLLLERRG